MFSENFKELFFGRKDLREEESSPKIGESVAGIPLMEFWALEKIPLGIFLSISAIVLEMQDKEVN